MEMDFVHSGEVTHVTIAFGGGEKLEFWQIGRYNLSRSTQTGKILILKSDPEAPPYPYALGKTFYGLENVKPADDKGEADFGGAPCLYYHGSSPDYEAWFDAATGLPKAYREGGATLVYEFFPAAPQGLALPAEWRAAWEKHRLRLRAAGLAR